MPSLMPNRAAFKLLFSILLSACCIPLAAAQIPTQTQGLASGFEVQITLSQQAAAKLASQSQGMVLVAAFSANAAPDAKTPDGKLDLGQQTMDIPGRSETVR